MMTILRILIASAIVALGAVLPAWAQQVMFKNFSEVQVTGPIARELSTDNHALIIYNAQYEHDGISDLPVTENDAKAVQKLFEGMGYPTEDIEVTWAQDYLWDVFEKDGTFLGSVEMPRDFSRYPSPVFDGDFVWAITRDDFDVQRIVRYRIELDGA